MSGGHVWFARRGDYLLATDEDSKKVLDRMEEGECQCFKRIASRDPIMHRRYWALLTVIAKQVKRIKIDIVDGKPVYMEIRDKDDAHTALKLRTGLYTTLPVQGTHYAVRIPKTTNFEGMHPDEWAMYWPSVMDAVIDDIAPDFASSSERNKLLRSIERWHREAA